MNLFMEGNSVITDLSVEKEPRVNVCLHTEGRGGGGGGRGKTYLLAGILVLLYLKTSPQIELQILFLVL